jgi:hypothetical protein
VRFRGSDFRFGLAAALSVALLHGASPTVAGAASRACRVPRLAGLTLEAARRRAHRAGCILGIEGAPPVKASIQTVRVQSPAAGRRASLVKVWLNRLCVDSATAPPGAGQPRLTPGPTGLVSGFYLVGGPALPVSATNCDRRVSGTGPGMVEVLDDAGDVLATADAFEEQLAEIALPAGSYSIRGTFLGALINGVHPTETQSLVIPAGDTVREDFLLSIS